MAMYAAKLPEVALAAGDRHGSLPVAARLVTALGVACAVWIASMLVAAAVGRILLELVQWVGALVLAVLGSGLRLPLGVVPHGLAQLTPIWPAFHLGQFARYALGDGIGVDLVPHVVGLVGVAAVFFVIARRGLGNVRQSGG
jgi:hypothetical protein